MSKRITILTFILTAFGLAMISSAGIFESRRDFGSNYYYFTHQLFSGALPGLITFFILSRVDYKFWKKLSLPVLILAIALLIFVFIPGFGLSAKGAIRWLDFRYISFQPSEILKLAFIFYLAAWLSRRGVRNYNSSALAPLLIILGIIGAILTMQPDLGTAIVIGGIVFAMFFLANIRKRYLIWILAVAALLVFGLSVLSPYRYQRITSFLNPSSDIQGASYQLNQGLIALGNGGIFGVGFGKSTQKLGLLPEPVTDSIFAIIGEELGLIGAFATLGLLGFLILTLVQLARKVKDSFASLLVSGVFSWIFIQTAINLGSILGLLPFTGITLPFISYGGTSLVVLSAGMGIVSNVARFENS